MGNCMCSSPDCKCTLIKPNTYDMRGIWPPPIDYNPFISSQDTSTTIHIKSPNSVTSNKGWECPKCSKVYAPFVPECGKCNG